MAIPNPLSVFSSFNSIFTFGAIAPNSIASSVRQGPANIVIRSGGTGNEQVKTAAESSLGITAEYFIDDVEIESIIAPTTNTRQTNATKISFKVREPYSMGNFLQTLAIAALEQGYSNYIDAGWLLTIEFVGWNDNGQAVTVDGTKRYFPLKLTSVDFTVTAGGSEYTVEAIPYNEQALSDEAQAMKEDIDIKGITVEDFLVNGIEGNDSLQDVLNTRELNQKEADQKKVSDVYLITFMDENGSPTGNNIGDAKITRNSYDQGNQLFGEPEPVEGNEGAFQRGNIVLHPEERRINFKKGTRIQEIIEELILLSEFARNWIDQEPDADGMKEWFKIRTVTYPQAVSPENTAQRGRLPRVYWFQISKFKYHSSKTNSPSVKAKGFENLKNQAVKEYNYIYSGENDDILDFNIEFNTAFFTTLQADLAQLAQDKVVGGDDRISEQEQDSISVVNSGAAQNARSGEAVASLEDSPNTNTGSSGGGVEQSTKNNIARKFNELVLNGVDLLTMNLQILGDPYYIADEEVGSYTSRQSSLSPNINEDGSISYGKREVDVLVNFRTPIDIGRDGSMQFPNIETESVGQFSGLYQVITVRNSISENKFTQELELIRRRNQEGSEKGEANLTEDGSKENALADTADAPRGVIGDLQRRSQASGTAIATGTDIFSASGEASERPAGQSSARDKKSTQEPQSDQDIDEKGKDVNQTVRGNSNQENLGMVDEGPRRIYIRKDASDYE